MTYPIYHSYGNDTPILDIRGAARLWMCLPGARATAFRATLADTWIRVFGGDLTLVDEIHRNREIQTQLPQHHPGRAFGDAVSERHGTEQVLSTAASFHDIRALVQSAMDPFIQRLEEERVARLALQNTLDTQTARLQLETTARVELENRLQENIRQCTNLSRELATANDHLHASETIANELAIQVAGIRTAQRVEYQAEAFDHIVTLDSFIASPPTTAVRFKDLFRFMGVIGVKEEVSMACGRKTHHMAPGIGHRKQRGRDGREYVTIDYRKSQAPVMLRGIMAVCYEHDHRMETEDGPRCICRECRNLMNVLRR